MDNIKCFSDLKGHTLSSIENQDDARLLFTLDNGDRELEELQRGVTP